MARPSLLLFLPEPASPPMHESFRLTFRASEPAPVTQSPGTAQFDSRSPVSRLQQHTAGWVGGRRRRPEPEAQLLDAGRVPLFPHRFLTSPAKGGPLRAAISTAAARPPLRSPRATSPVRILDPHPFRSAGDYPVVVPPSLRCVPGRSPGPDSPDPRCAPLPPHKFTCCLPSHLRLASNVCGCRTGAPSRTAGSQLCEQYEPRPMLRTLAPVSPERPKVA